MVRVAAPRSCATARGGAFSFSSQPCNSIRTRSSYFHKPTVMRTLILLFGLAGAPLAAFSQVDTTTVPTPAEQGTDKEQEQRYSISLGVNSKEGMMVQMDGPIDTTTNKQKPLVIETKRKKISIFSEPREWLSPSDSVADRLKQLRTERRNLFTYWSGLDLGVNTLLGPDGSADLDPDAEFLEVDNSRSRFFSINFMEQKFEFGSHHVGLMTGLGWEFTSYHLENNVFLAYDADSIYGVPVDSPEYSKNKLRQMGFRVPLMFEFNTKRAPLPTEAELLAGNVKDFDRKGNFHIAVGVVGSWYFDTMYKQKYRTDGDNRKDRSKGDYQLLPYRAAASVRLGYGGLNLFAEYALTPFVREGKGPELSPLNVGLTIIGFN